MLPPDIPTAPVDTLVITIPASTYRMLRSLAAESHRTPREYASILVQLAVIREQVARRKLFAEGERG